VKQRVTYGGESVRIELLIALFVILSVISQIPAVKGWFGEARVARATREGII
jgi:hypothetical protein